MSAGGRPTRRAPQRRSEVNAGGKGATVQRWPELSNRFGIGGGGHFQAATAALG